MSFSAPIKSRPHPMELLTTMPTQTEPASANFVERTLLPFRGAEHRLASQPGLSRPWQYAAFLAALLVLVTRSPSYFTHAQFYAEDGMVFFQQAYNDGWLHSFFIPVVGYLTLIQRLGTGPALLVPVVWAPLAMAVFGLFVQALPVAVLLSARCRNWAPLPTRILWAILYLALPATQEVHVVLTNSMWHLAVVAILLAFAAPPRTASGKLVDILLFIVTGLSGPFAVLLVPFVLFFWWKRRQTWALAAACILGLTSLLQLAIYARHHADRIPRPLGATPALFLRFVGSEVFASAVTGRAHAVTNLPLPSVLAVVLVGLAICIYVMRHSTLEFKLLLTYSFTLLLAELRSPLTGGSDPPWVALASTAGGRYWYVPMVAFVFACAWCALNARRRLFEFGGAAVLVLMCVGIVKDWSLPPFPEDHFAAGVERLHAARPGEHVVIRISPKGWSTDLIRKASW